MTDHHDHFPYEEDLPYEDATFPEPDVHDPDPGLHEADFDAADIHASPQSSVSDLSELSRGADVEGHGEPEPPDHAVAAPDLPAEPAEAVDVFPPAVDVGALPEPVDGFPWIDSGSLGLADIAAAVERAGLDPVRPEELAEYAATELTPGVDPWAELADSDDPATSNLARWWSPN